MLISEISSIFYSHHDDLRYTQGRNGYQPVGRIPDARSGALGGPGHDSNPQDHDTTRTQN